MKQDKLNDLAVFLDGQIEKLEKLKHGGKRLNAGAKPKYNEPTETKTFRIPISKVEEVNEMVREFLAGLERKNNQ